MLSSRFGTLCSLWEASHFSISFSRSQSAAVVVVNNRWIDGFWCRYVRSSTIREKLSGYRSLGWNLVGSCVLYGKHRTSTTRGHHLDNINLEQSWESAWYYLDRGWEKIQDMELFRLLLALLLADQALSFSLSVGRVYRKEHLKMSTLKEPEDQILRRLDKW